MSWLGHIPHALAQVSPMFYDYPQNHLEWFTIDTEHFKIHFQQGNERSAVTVSVIAEEVYGPITQLYRHEPDGPISIVLKDREDYANGAAYFFDNKIDIWIPSLDSPLRGSHDWLRNVITHEFTHMIQIQSMMTRKRRTPAVYFQWLAYEKVRRPDVLYGFPRGVVTQPFASVAVPAWFAEGTAQYQRQGLGYDRWDAHRDMILRTRVLSETQLNFVTMGNFSSKTSLERETIYNHGFAFSLYLAERFGESILAEISWAAADSGYTDFSKVMEVATGVPGEQLYNEFIVSSREQYIDALELAETKSSNITRTNSVAEVGFFNLNPVVSPDGSKLAYISNKQRDYSRAQLFLMDVNESEPSADGSSESNRRDANFGSPSFESSSYGSPSFGPASPVADLSGLGLTNAAEEHLISHGLHEKPLIDYVATTFSFSPDAGRIAYSRTRKPNAKGERYSDIWLYDIDEEKDYRLTTDQRLSDPSWNPTRPLLAAIQQMDGTQNLILFNVVEGQINDSKKKKDSAAPIGLERNRALTEFKAGEAIFTPRWSPDGNTLYFASISLHGREIHSLDIETGEFRTLLSEQGVDYRDPWLDPEGVWLYYSADPDGRFSIFRLHLASGVSQRLVKVLGGAFTPSIQNDILYFAEYKADGYKISSVNLTEIQPEVESELWNRRITPSWGQPKPALTPEIEALSKADDRAIAEQFAVAGIQIVRGAGSASEFDEGELVARAIESGMVSSGGLVNGQGAATGGAVSAGPETITGAGGSIGPEPALNPKTTSGGTQATATLASAPIATAPLATASPYTETTTGFSFFPLLRLDAYTQLRGTYASNIGAGDLTGLSENLWRDVKIGTYFSSRDVLDRVTLFGGLAVGPGSQSASGVGNFVSPSRLLELDRDLFLSLEYRGLPFIRRRWSPTVTAELFNIKRNVRDGLNIEEFPCTSCLPETTTADIRYTIWEAALHFRSKVNRFTLLEAGVSYSPYRVNIEGFTSRELRQFIPESSSEYYRGMNLTGAWITELIEPTRHEDIAPNGVKSILRYRYQPGKLLDRYEIEDGMLAPKFNTTRNHSLEFKSILGMAAPEQLPGQFNALLTLRGFAFLNNPNNGFYTDYIGGFFGMRSYPYFALGGNQTAFARLALLHPLLTGLNRQIGTLSIDKVFLNVFYEAGNVWNSQLEVSRGIKQGIGAELRFSANNYYLFPMKFFLNGAYGLNPFTIKLSDEFVNSSQGDTVRYGREFRLTFGLTFEFDTL